jgi:hypothetical protein
MFAEDPAIVSKERSTGLKYQATFPDGVSSQKSAKGAPKSETHIDLIFSQRWEVRQVRSCFL